MRADPWWGRPQTVDGVTVRAVTRRPSIIDPTPGPSLPASATTAAAAAAAVVGAACGAAARCS